jgi:putative endonuclease
MVSGVNISEQGVSPPPMAAWVYILECADGSFYTGCTTNIDNRIGQHQAGEIEGYTATRLPVRVVHVTEFQTIHDAIDVERQIKRWSRAKKQALIDGRFAELPGLSLSRWRREGS